MRSSTSLQPRRVLIFENDAVAARVLSTALRAAGFAAACATSARDWVAGGEDALPDLVVWSLSVDGGALAGVQQLRRVLGEHAVPIVLLASELSADLLPRSIEVGAADVLLTPLDPAQLVASITARLRERGLGDDDGESGLELPWRWHGAGSPVVAGDFF